MILTKYICIGTGNDYGVNHPRVYSFTEYMYVYVTLNGKNYEVKLEERNGNIFMFSKNWLAMYSHTIKASKHGITIVRDDFKQYLAEEKLM